MQVCKANRLGELVSGNAKLRRLLAEVRIQDAALILMLVERLERADKISGHANNKAAIKAGRAWLEAKK